MCIIYFLKIRRRSIVEAIDVIYYANDLLVYDVECSVIGLRRAVCPRFTLAAVSSTVASSRAGDVVILEVDKLNGVVV